MPLEFDGVNGIVKNTTSDGDVTIKGNDDGSEISAVTFDMSTAGKATFNNDIALGDSQKAVFGASEDLQIYHDGSHSYISDQGTGDLRILAANSFVVKKADASENIITANADGAVGLSYDASQKLATTATGIEINGGFTATDGCTITTADNDPQLILTSTDADADEGPRMNFVRNSGSPANNDVLARISLQGKDAGANTTSYAELETTAVNVAEGSETGKFNIKVAVAGSVNQDVITMTGSEVVINDSSNDLDFRVESNNNSGMFFVNAGSDHVSVGTDGDLGGVFNVSGETVMRTAGNSDTLTLKCTDADAEEGPILRLTRDSSSPANNDVLGRMFFTGEDAGSNATNYVQLTSQASNVAEGSETANFQFEIFNSGSLVEFQKFQGGTGTVFNEGSNDLDFRVESNGNANMLFIDAGNDHVNIGTSSDLGGVLNVNGQTVITTADNTDTLSLISTDADASDGPILRMYRNSGSPADGDLTGIMKFVGRNDNSQDVNYGLIRAFIRDASDGSEDGTIQINHIVAGTERNALELDNDEYVFNNAGIDVDFRVESDANANRFKLDAGDDVIVMGTGTVEDSVYGAKPALQLTGTDFNSSAFSIIRNSADASSPNLIFGKSRSADGNTVVQNGDDLGNITFAAADGTDQNNTAARIYAEVDGTPGANDTPGRLVFATTADGANSATERVRIHQGGVMSASQGIALGVGTANTASNVLNDYEEGTWTPTFNGTAGAPSGVSYNRRVGWYEKVGDMVSIHCYLEAASMSSVPSGGLTITGLPFTTISTTEFFHAATVSFTGGFASTEAPQGGYLAVNGTLVNMVTNASNDGRDNLNDTVTCANAMSGNEQLVMHATYRTA
jgi:hypothetical protein